MLQVLLSSFRGRLGLISKHMYFLALDEDFWNLHVLYVGLYFKEWENCEGLGFEMGTNAHLLKIF